MKHNHLTDQQIRDALLKAGYEHLWKVAELRAVLGALPDPVADEWEQCAFEDYKPGDYAKWTHAGQTVEYDAPINGIVMGHAYIAEGLGFAYVPAASYYRIPAPVQHPDPEVHPVIIVSGAYDVEWGHAYAYVSDGTGYNIVEPINSDSRLLPEAIHNWTPAKVVEDGR